MNWTIFEKSQNPLIPRLSFAPRFHKHISQDFRNKKYPEKFEKSKKKLDSLVIEKVDSLIIVQI